MIDKVEQEELKATFLSNLCITAGGMQCSPWRNWQNPWQSNPLTPFRVKDISEKNSITFRAILFSHYLENTLVIHLVNHILEGMKRSQCPVAT